MRMQACTAAIFLAAAVSSASAAALDFDFKDPKSVNGMYFLLDSEVEPIMGLATGISGTVSFDPADPKKTTGKIVVTSDSIQTNNKDMTAKLHEADWLNVKEHPEVSFTFKEVKEAKKSGENGYELSVLGEFSCKGKKKDLTVPVRATYQKDQLGQRLRGAKGDLLILRTEFKINRKDFDIKSDMGNTVVAEEIQIRAAIVGMHAEK
jgi:polyisoprenoid-binding protein YceI